MRPRAAWICCPHLYDATRFQHGAVGAGWQHGAVVAKYQVDNSVIVDSHHSRNGNLNPDVFRLQRRRIVEEFNLD